MIKNAAVNFGYHCHCFHYFFAIVNLSKTVAVIAKVDCRVFYHINCLGDKISNTAAPIQPNPFWFWEKLFIYLSTVIHISTVIHTGCPKSHCAKVRAYCSACDHLIRKISPGMFQKSSSFEEFNGFSEIDVHFFE